MNTRTERLLYILKRTMGCPDTFERRSEEVGILARAFGEYPPGPETHGAMPLHGDLDGREAGLIEVLDEAVIDSFLYKVGHPKGSMRQYLLLSSIAAIVGSEHPSSLPCRSGYLLVVSLLS